jgi:hypothetical protein
VRKKCHVLFEWPLTKPESVDLISLIDDRRIEDRARDVVVVTADANEVDEVKVRLVATAVT